MNNAPSSNGASNGNSLRWRGPQRQGMHERSLVRSRAVRGFSLIELMIALLLGLLVVASALAIFASNSRTYRATENLGRTQESSRVAFELMSHDIRESGTTPCGNQHNSVSSVLTNTGNNWYDWGQALTGVLDTDPIPDGGPAFGLNKDDRVAGTDALVLRTATPGGVKVSTHDPGVTTGTFTTVGAHGFKAGDIVVVCDYRRGSIFQVTTVTPPSTLTYSTGGGSLNNSILLGGCLEITDCIPGNYDYDISGNAVITRLSATRWYIGRNVAGANPNCAEPRNCSLYLQNVQEGTATTPEEIARGVTDLQLQYLLNTNKLYYQTRVVTPAGAYAAIPGDVGDPVAITDDEWSRILAVRMNMSLVGSDSPAGVGDQVPRQLAHTVTLRNQNP